MPLSPSPCISFTTYQNWVYNRTFLSSNLRRKILHLQTNQSTLTCWTPRHPDPNSRPSLLLLHGFGANCTWQWSSYLDPLIRSGFDLYIPNLLFFGESRTDRSDRSEAFQAECVMEAMAAMGVDRIRAVVGVSYGGFVGHRIAAMFGGKVERVVLVSAGVCLEEEDLRGGMFAVGDLEEAASILVPQTPERLRRLVRLSHYRMPAALPACFLWDYIHVSLLNSDSEVSEDV